MSSSGSETSVQGIITRDRFDAVLFDLDGVLTSTAAIHASCWKKMFDTFLEHRRVKGGQPQEDLRPFEIATDYKKYVDGKPRYEGTASFLESRNIHLPRGEMSDPAGRETVCGLGNQKDDMVKHAIDAGEVEAFEGSVALLKHVRQIGLRTAVVSSSRNCAAVLRAARLEDLFEARVDGVTAEEAGLPGKPAPATFLEAARRLHAAPSRAVVIEDAISGVQAGRSGGFGLVIGVDREGGESNTGMTLLHHGADIVVNDLAELLPHRGR